jgi:hypothetical protein
MEESGRLHALAVISQYSIDRRLGGSQSRSGFYGEEKNLVLPGIESGPSSSSLSRLVYFQRLHLNDVLSVPLFSKCSFPRRLSHQNLYAYLDAHIPVT